MPNKSAKMRKRKRRLINIKLKREGRTSSQIARKLKKKLKQQEDKYVQ